VSDSLDNYKREAFKIFKQQRPWQPGRY